jgi:purine-binding chemotaxis protein CheW
MATKKYVTFRLDDQLFGIDIVHVREINRLMEFTEVPGSPDYFYGLINLRGQIVSILDMKRRLGMGSAILGEHTHNIILKTEGPESGGSTGSGAELSGMSDRVGMLVDAIGDIVTAEENEIDAPPANLGEIDGQYLDNVFKAEQEVITLLNVGRLIAV